MKKQLFIDGQLFQTEAWNRGMGKIALEFIRALQRRPGFERRWDITVLLNDNLRDESRDRLVGQAFLGKADMVYVTLELPAGGKSYDEVAAASRQALNRIVANRDGAVYFIPALFEHAIAPVFPDGLKRVLLFHDLIPMLYAEHYLRNEQLRRGYYERFGEFLSADLVVANSDTTRNDLLRFLNIEPEVVRTVYGAGFDRSAVEPEPIADLDDRPFVLMPSGDDFRKNNERCVRAFADFNARTGGRYRLVLTSSFGEETKRALRALSPDLHFAGVVSEGQFRWLFKHAKIMFWGPQYEGLGMPLLEAMAEGTGRIACSDISVFREIAQQDPVLFFDPEDVQDMSAKLEEAEGMPEQTAYPALSVFTWERTGELLEAVLESAAGLSTERARKQKIAVVGPDPRGYSSIGKFIQELHPSLSRRFDVDYYFEQSVLTNGEFRTSFLPYITHCAEVSQLDARTYAQYEAVWYHIGNSDYHVQTVQRALTYPGYVVLHDTRLRGLFDQLVQRGHISEERYRTEESFRPLRESDFITSLVNSARGLLVHSRDALQKVSAQQVVKATNTKQTYHPIGAFEPVAAASKRGAVIGFGGFATPREDDLGFRMLQTMLADDRFRECRFHLFGSGFNYDAANRAMASLLSDPRVKVSSDLSDLQFQDILGTLDILFNYRSVYNGETSRFTLEAMRYGACVLVRDIGWYAELPGEAVSRAQSEAETVEQAAALIADAGKRERMADAARQYAAGLTAAGYAKEMAALMRHSGLRSYPAAYIESWQSSLSEAGVSIDVLSGEAVRSAERRSKSAK